MEQISDPEINPCNYSHLIFNKRAPSMHCRRLKPESCLSSCANINSKWIDNLKTQNFETIAGKNRETLGHISTGNNILNRTLITQQIKGRIDKWNCIKLKTFYSAKETITRLKRQPPEQEKIFGSDTSDKGLLTRI
jgi:hypothetical protein